MCPGCRVRTEAGGLLLGPRSLLPDVLGEVLAVGGGGVGNLRILLRPMRCLCRLSVVLSLVGLLPVGGVAGA